MSDALYRRNIIGKHNRRIIQQGGVSVNDEKVADPDFRFTEETLAGEGAVVRKGKKTFHRFVAAK